MTPGNLAPTENPVFMDLAQSDDRLTPLELIPRMIDGLGKVWGESAAGLCILWRQTR